MQQYIIRRILLMIPTLLIVTIGVFSLVRLMPGDVVLNQLAQAPSFRKQDADAIRKQLGIDKPWIQQYWNWISGIPKGNFGKSLWSREQSGKLIKDRAPITLELAVITFIIANVFAILFGIYSAIHQDSVSDYVIRFTSILFLSIPTFWIGTLVIVLGARWFSYLPPLTYISFKSSPLTNMRQFLLPAVVLALGSSAIILRLVRSSMLEVLRQDYVRTAFAKGLKQRTVVYAHCLKNAMMPVVTVQGFQLGYLITGSVVIEVIFSLPGLGRLVYEAVNNRDYTLVQAVTVVFAMMFLLINLVVDLSYAWLDPRIKY